MIRQKVIDNYRDMVASLKTELKLAEAEVERLQDENARLRRVAEAARGAYDYYDMVWDGGIAHELDQAIAELNKAKEGQE